MLLRREWLDWDLQEIRRHQYAYLARKNLRTAQPPPIIKRLSARRKTALLEMALDILADWRWTPFEFEGAVRSGIRRTLCLEAWPWRDADIAASQTVEAALKRLGAERPTWHQGQPEWTDDGFSPIERTRCVQCGNLLPESRGEYGRKFCDSACSEKYLKHGFRKFGEPTSRSGWVARVGTQAEKTKRDRMEVYDLREEHWRNDYHHHLRAERRAAVRADRRCQVCDASLGHLSRADARYCSKHCQMIAYHARKSMVSGETGQQA